MRKFDVALAAMAALVAASCDNSPNTNFEQSVKDREAAEAGDPYALLESSMPKQVELTYRRTDQYQGYADGQSGAFRANYDTLLTTLDGDKKVDLKIPPGDACRASFTAASAFQKSPGPDAKRTWGVRKLADALRACRAAARKSGDKGKTLARFASTGLAMVGAKLVGQGDQDLGLKLWGEGEKAAGEDKPAFELGVKSLRGY